MLLQEEISEKEIHSTLSSFQKGKNTRSWWLSVEFFLGFFDLLKYDLVKVVNESQRMGKVWGSFNSTFLALIPKKKDLDSFTDFHLISCCNLIYKLIAKIIASHLKPIFNDSISEEQFGFLNGHQIHDVVYNSRSPSLNENEENHLLL
jgi:hypothetical protein